MKAELQTKFDRYSESHQNPINQIIHSIAVPVIYFSVLGLFWLIPVPGDLPAWLNFSSFAMAVTVLFYVNKSLSLAIGLLLLSILSIAIFSWMSATGISIATVSITIFVIAWIAQFIGHHIEGQKPSFFEDLRYLLVGPGWVIAKLYRRLHIPL